MKAGLMITPSRESLSSLQPRRPTAESGCAYPPRGRGATVDVLIIVTPH